MRNDERKKNEKRQNRFSSTGVVSCLIVVYWLLFVCSCINCIYHHVIVFATRRFVVAFHLRETTLRKREKGQYQFPSTGVLCFLIFISTSCILLPTGKLEVASVCLGASRRQWSLLRRISRTLPSPPSSFPRTGNVGHPTFTQRTPPSSFWVWRTSVTSPTALFLFDPFPYWLIGKSFALDVP